MRSGVMRGAAYGLEFDGIALGPGPIPAGLMPPGEVELPRIAIDHDDTLVGDREPVLDGGRAHFRLADGLRSLSVSRADARAVYHGPALTPDQLVHPYLMPAATVYSRWLGREAFHAGALVVGGRAWALLGASEAGKSTLLAAFAGRGGDVLCDDLVVVEGDRAFAGPRCIDLRSRPSDRLAGALPCRLIPERPRWRLALGPIAVSVPLGGWVFLSTGDQLDLREVGAAECLGRLAAWRARRQLASDPAQMLSLAGLPAFALCRTRSWTALPQTLDALISALVVADTPAGTRAGARCP